MNKTLLTTVLCLTFILQTSILKSEITTAISVDWLSVDADLIVQGQIIEIKEYNSSQGTSAIIKIMVQSVLKGKCSDTISVQVDFYSSNWGLKKFENKTAILFLKNILDKDNFYQLLKAQNSQFYSIINLNSSEIKVFAGNFKVLKTEKEIVEYINQVVIKSSGLKSTIGCLDVPYESEAHTELYSGSSCYIWVPLSLYPEAKKSFFN